MDSFINSMKIFDWLRAPTRDNDDDDLRQKTDQQTPKTQPQWHDPDERATLYQTFVKERLELQRSLNKNMMPQSKPNSPHIKKMQREMAALRHEKDDLQRRFVDVQDEMHELERAFRNTCKTLALTQVEVTKLRAEKTKYRCPVDMDIDEFLRRGRERLEQVE